MPNMALGSQKIPDLSQLLRPVCGIGAMSQHILESFPIEAHQW